LEPLIRHEGVYEPAPLDDLSFLNGWAKWQHPQCTLDTTEFETVLNWLDRLYGADIEVPKWSKEVAFDKLDDSKSPGFPYVHLYGHTKGWVKKFLRPSDMIRHFWRFVQIVAATLKDELRLVGKDARFFTPVNIIMAFVGNLCFGAQNEALEFCHNFKPIKIGLRVPGFEAYNLWREFLLAEGVCFETDGAQNDSHFPLVLALLIREFRKRHLPKSMHRMVDRYYQMAYMMLVNIRGHLLPLYGMPTGHTNTASDNSLGYLALVMLHCIRVGLSYDDFRRLNLNIMGDDMLFRSPFPEVNVFAMNRTWNSVGMYLESPGAAKPMNVVFCGMSPVIRKVFGKEFLLYGYSLDRTRDSWNYVSIDMSSSERFSKLISLLTLIFPYEREFEYLREVARDFLRAHKGRITESCKRLVVYLDDRMQLNLHLSLESRVLSFLPQITGA
jgi:hypothetical protein